MDGTFRGKLLGRNRIGHNRKWTPEMLLLGVVGGGVGWEEEGRLCERRYAW